MTQKEKFFLIGVLVVALLYPWAAVAAFVGGFIVGNLKEK